ncbi:MAG: glycerophosphodiester phosphodiesterase [Chloroflexota bacterium]
MTLIYAHRGASGYAPENTLAAFDRALEMPIDGIETDIRATLDGILVLLHDATVDRTTSGSGAVATLTLAQIQQLDAGSHFSDAFAGQRIPTLVAFLDHYAERTRFWLEIKAPGVESELAAIIRERGLFDRAQFTSFDFESLRRMRDVAPEASLAFLTRELAADTLARCTAIGVAQISIHNSTLTPAVIASVRQAGMDARTWGIADKATLRKVLELGVYGLTLNWPDWAGEGPPATRPQSVQ